MKRPINTGIDLSQTTDLTSVGFVARLENGKYFVKQHSFMPEDRLKERMKTDRVPYDLWIKQGHLTVTPGAVVDYDFVESYLVNLRDNGYKLKEVDYDKWNASQFAQNLDKAGFDPVEIPQSIKHLGEPTKRFREEVYKGNVIHENDPLLAWAIGNAITKQDDQENIMLSKKRSRNRIDPIAAVINAFARAMVQKRESIYKTRGAFIL
jgi:phage terminase large subunit-like protein